MTMTKEQLLVEYEKAKDARDSWRTDYYNIKWERDKLQEELDDLRWRLQKSRNQIHFLAWMLYWKWVDIDDNWWRLDVNIIVKEPESCTSTFTYCNENK